MAEITDKQAKRKKAQGEAKDWFMLLIDTKRDLEKRIYKLERRVKELEDGQVQPYRRIGVSNIHVK